MKIEFDVTGFDKLADDLDDAADQLLVAVTPVVRRGAVNVKAAMRADMSASKHFSQVTRSITFDVTTTRGGVEAQVGPVTRGETVGDLAHFAYFGGANGGGGTVRDPQGALDDEADGFEDAISKVLGDML